MKHVTNVYYTDACIPEQSMDIHLPSGECRAVFLYMHGGGLENGKKEGQAKVGEYLAEKGYAFASINYRMYPTAAYPDFIEDAAAAVAYLKKNLQAIAGCDRLFVGGSSAGGYLSMMLCYDPKYLSRHGLSNADIAGYFHDAGQPTAHFHVLEYDRQLDSRRVIVDESAPLYHIGLLESYPPQRFIVSDNDMVGRYEQTMLLLRTLSHFGYSHYDHVLMHGRHCEYVGKIGEDGFPIVSHLIEDFMDNADHIA